MRCSNVEVSERLCGVCKSIDLSGRHLGGWLYSNGLSLLRVGESIIRR